MSMRSLLLIGLTVAGVAVVAVVAGAAPAADKPAVKNYFNVSTDGLLYTTDAWSIRSVPGKGWVSLKVRDAEFLHATDQRGGMAFRTKDTWVTYFPDHNTITHDQSIGRTGSVADGTFLVKVTPDQQQPQFELYVGYNETEPHEFILFLSDDVAFARLGYRPGSDRTWARSVVMPGGALAKTTAAVLVHKTGVSLVVNAPCRVGTVEDPAGEKRFAVVFETKGHAANAMNFLAEPAVHTENFVMTPQFDVTSSDDGENTGLKAAHGVTNPNYGPDTKIDFNITFGLVGAKSFDGFVELDVVHALGEQHVYERKELKGAVPGEDGRIRVHFDPKFHLPGVSDVWGRVCDSSGRLLWVERFRMSWDWASYRPDIRVEPDMKAFWDDTLKQLREIPLEPEIKRVFEDHPKLEIYEVSYKSWGGKRVYAGLFIPKGAKLPLPVVVGSHPSATDFKIQKGKDGLYGSKIDQDLRFVTILPFLRNKPGEDPGFNMPWWGPIQSRDDYIARAWYCHMVRALDYLATRPELADMDRVVAKGGSQGGALALITAALDDRVDYCLADCPSNCQPHEILNCYGSFGPSKGVAPAGVTVEEMERILSYYNPVNFCPWIKCPAYVGSNIGDLTVHSMGPLAAYHNLTGLKPGQKDFYPGFTHAHGSGPGLGAKTKEVLEKLGGPEPAKAKEKE